MLKELKKSHFMLILAVPVDKYGTSTTLSCNKDLENIYSWICKTNNCNMTMATE